MAGMNPAPPDQVKNNQQHAPGPMNYKFSAEEVRVLKECNSESFYYRSLPISSALMVSAHLAVRAGYLKPNARFGSGVKVIGAGLFGYFVGKFSYQRHCEEKILKLPNSQLAEMLRRRRGLTTADSTQPDQGFGPTWGAPCTQQRSSSLDLDSDRNTEYQGLDDSQRPTVDTPDRPFVEEEPPKLSTSYEDLRRKNRDEYAAKQLGTAYRREQQSQTRDQPQQGAYSEQLRVPSRNRTSTETKKTKYGDEWAEE